MVEGDDLVLEGEHDLLHPVSHRQQLWILLLAVQARFVQAPQSILEHKLLLIDERHVLVDIDKVDGVGPRLE